MHMLPRSSASLPFLLVVVLNSPLFGAACPYLRQLQQGGGWDDDWDDDWDGDWDGSSPGPIIQQLFDNHRLISRQVTHNTDGTITTYTRSNDQAVAQLLRQHVATMRDRVENNMGVRHWDDFFVELFARRAEFDLQLPDPQPGDGVEAVMSATTSCGQALIEDHAAVVTLFVETGRAEGSKSHSVPPACLVAGDDEDGTPAVLDWFSFLSIFFEWLSSLFGSPF